MSNGSFFVIFALALLATASGTPLMRRLALRLNMIDNPAAHKPHQTPTPLLGGVAIYAAVVGVLLFFHNRHEIVQMSGILIAATWVSLLGVWDDRNDVGISAKLVTQMAATLVLIYSGVQVQLPIPEWQNLTLTFLWVIGITNAFNLLDNSDGLCGGMGAIAAVFFLIFASMNAQYLVGAFAAALLGACAGFLIYNFNPARIFMGDAGSLFIGFLLATLGIKLRFPNNEPGVTWMIPILTLGGPIFDTTMVTVSRLRRGHNPLTTPGTDHLSHRLIGLGWTPRNAVLVHYFIGCALGGIAFVVSVATAKTAYALAVCVLLAMAVALYWLERTSPLE